MARCSGRLPTCSPPSAARAEHGRSCRCRVGVVTTVCHLGGLSVVCVMLAQRINQNSQNLNSGVGSRLARGQHK